MALIDTHLFGAFDASDAASGRFVRTFTYGVPTMSAGLRAHLAAGLRKETYPDSPYEPTVTHTLGLLFENATPDALATNINATLLAIIPGVDWVFQARSASYAYTARVLDVKHSETYKAVASGRTFTALDLTITCEAGWKRPEVTITPTGAASTPALYAVPGVVGSMPAPFRASVTFDDDVDGVYLGFRHSATEPLLVQDLAGTADAHAVGGQAASATMDADGVLVGDGTDLDANDEAGWYLLSARLEQPDATPGDTTYQAISTVTGSGIAVTQSFTTEAVPATVAGEYRRTLLGPLPIPAGAVPDVATGSGWSAESSITENTVDDGTKTISSSGSTLDVRQSFAAFTGQITAIEFTIDAAPVVSSMLLKIFKNATVESWMLSDFTTGTKKFVLPAPYPVSSSDTLAFGLYSSTGSSLGWTIGLAASNGDYAGGALTTPIGSGESAGDDLTFKVYGQTQLGFNSTVGVQATSSESSKTAQVDYLVRVPTDEGYACITKDFAAAQGIVIDESAPLPQKHNIYLADADGIGPSVLAQASEWRGSLMLRPGYNVYTVAAYTPVAAAPGGGTAWAWYRPRYLTCGS